MSRYAYVNGQYRDHQDGMIHIEDRGYQFADGVYEVVMIYQDRLVDEEGHLDRLEGSLQEVKIRMPLSRAALKLIMRELIRRNDVKNGIIYLQINRGVAPRDHKFPVSSKPSVVMTTKRLQFSTKNEENGVKIISLPDLRWKRCDIKSISLLPNVLAKQQAAENNAFEAWLIDSQDMVTEGTSSNAWIVTHQNKVITRKASKSILNGITRQTLLRIMHDHQVELEERSFSLQEALEAKEAFLTSSSAFVMPVCQINNTLIGGGNPGPFTLDILREYKKFLQQLPILSRA